MITLQFSHDLQNLKASEVPAKWKHGKDVKCPVKWMR